MYPKKQIKPPETYPSEKAGFLVREKFIYEAWIRILNMIMTFGTNKESQYSEMQKELISFTAVVEEEDPEDPKIMHCFDFSKEDLEKYYPQVLSPQKIEGIEYTYGQRLMDHKGVNQIEKLIERLKKVSHTRRAIAFTWDVTTDYDNDKSPCLNMVHALVQDDRLFLTAYFRSNDMYGAWPRNAFALRKLQKKIADEVGVKMGPLITISNSAHIYKSSWKKAQAVLEHFSLPPKRIGDPRGNIIIRTDKDEIVMVREGPDGKRIAELRAKNTFEAYHKLSAIGAVSEMSHAFYLGTELAKAEKAIKEKTDYMQDN
jgi:thymidylate synthase